MQTLRFGIPTLDRLLGSPGVAPGEPGSPSVSGYGIPGDTGDSTSMCIIGNDGTGKSVLALHLSAQYQRDHGPSTRAIYTSLDLSLPRARLSWNNFALGSKNRITDPFSHSKTETPTRDIELTKFGNSPNGSVEFLDLRKHTKGDDWGFLNRLVASEPRPNPNTPLSLLVIDAVEGLESQSGNLDSYGESRDRRSRVNQLVRAAEGKFHVVLLAPIPHQPLVNEPAFVR